MLDVPFFLNSLLLGVGLAIDAFSVSVVNGIYEPLIKKRRACLIAGVFAVFQFIMPLIGWVLVKTLITVFSALERFIPYFALLLLGFLGVKSIIAGIKNEEEKVAVGFGALIVQGIATSIDALSVGLTIADYGVIAALIASAIIGAVTFILCFVGVIIGKNIGKVASRYANIIGGIVLIAIGIEIFIKGII